MLERFHNDWRKVFRELWSLPFAVLNDIIGQVEKSKLSVGFG